MQELCDRPNWCLWAIFSTAPPLHHSWYKSSKIFWKFVVKETTEIHSTFFKYIMLLILIDCCSSTIELYTQGHLCVFIMRSASSHKSMMGARTFKLCSDVFKIFLSHFLRKCRQYLKVWIPLPSLQTCLLHQFEISLWHDPTLYTEYPSRLLYSSKPPNR